MLRVIGLTGGIASGKSTVSSYLFDKGYSVIDADKLVRNLQDKDGQLYHVLMDWLGEDILLENGELNRDLLGEMIFSSEENLEKSAQLQNPIIRQELASQLKNLQSENDVVFMDIPLLFEQGYEDWCDEVWLVWVDEETQLERLMVRNAYTETEARLRISKQMPLREKKQKADRLIDNSASLQETYCQVDDLLDGINKVKKSK